MIRVGIDLVEVASVEAALRAHGDKYLNRVYTPAEVAQCGGAAAPDVARLAARFAAKEATLKVLRVPDDGISWPSIEVVRASWGGVELALSGVAAERAAEHGLTTFAVSVSHDGAYATAAVVAEVSAPPE